MQVLLQTSIADYKYPVLPQLLARRPIVHVQVHSAHPASSKDSPCNEAEEHLSIFPHSPFPIPHSYPTLLFCGSASNHGRPDKLIRDATRWL
jgi:hypothetical protein